MTREEAIKEMREKLPWLTEDTKRLVEAIIPELEESEDERMINELQGFLRSFGSDYFGSGEWQKFDDWLERQKELFESGRGLYYYDGEKTTYCGYPAAEENPYDFAMSQQEKQEEPHYTKRNALFDKCVENCDPEVMKSVSDEVDEMLEKEQKLAEHSAKGRRGRIGTTPEHIRKKAENFLSKMEPPYDADDICSAYETGAMENANLSWSEEDEKMLRTIISDGSRGVELDSKQISFLKSLRPSWKPSEEHLSALLAIFNDPNNIGSQTCQLALTDLYEQLKRMM